MVEVDGKVKLCEINVVKWIMHLHFDACKAGSCFGHSAAAYTDFRYVSAVKQRDIWLRSTIRISITGFMSNPKVLLHPEVLKEGKLN